LTGREGEGRLWFSCYIPIETTPFNSPTYSNSLQYTPLWAIAPLPMTRWEFRTLGGNASATCLKMLVIRFADVNDLRLII